jgi:hypothetical protein
MTNLTTKTMTHRDLLLMINDANEPNFNPFTVAKQMMLALKCGTITNNQYDNLSKELDYECKRNNVDTKNEIASLF